MGFYEYSSVETLLFKDAEIMNEGDLCIRYMYTEAIWDEKRGLLVMHDGVDITEDVDEELSQRLIDHFKEENIYLKNLKEGENA